MRAYANALNFFNVPTTDFVVVQQSSILYRSAVPFVVGKIAVTIVAAQQNVGPIPIRDIIIALSRLITVGIRVQQSLLFVTVIIALIDHGWYRFRRVVTGKICQSSSASCAVPPPKTKPAIFLMRTLPASFSIPTNDQNDCYQNGQNSGHARKQYQARV